MQKKIMDIFPEALLYFKKIIFIFQNNSDILKYYQLEVNYVFWLGLGWEKTGDNKKSDFDGLQKRRDVNYWSIKD